MPQLAVQSGSLRPSSPSSPPTSLHFQGFDHLVDQVHRLFAKWEGDQTFQPPLDVPALHQMKLAVHEWLSNLIQHASFADRTPEIWLSFAPNGDTVWCAIEDNSDGFDLDGRLSARSEIIESFPERGMGLLMIKACTIELSYRRVDTDRQRLEFLVSAEQDPWLNIPF